MSRFPHFIVTDDLERKPEIQRNVWEERMGD